MEIAMTTAAMAVDAAAAASKAQSLVDAAERVIRGKRDFLELLAAAFLARGHVLIEDNPGLGKTTAAKTFARLLSAHTGTEAEGENAGLVFKRIQFTPDLLPYDITGVDIWDPQTRSFRFMPGPALSNMVLGDEINRAAPKVQSALLEVMAEGQITIGMNTYKPPEPFFVLATENPIESEGVFPLPAAQLDRFMMKLSMGYPERQDEIDILEHNPSATALETLEPVMSVSEFIALQEAAAGIFVHRNILEAATDIIRATRTPGLFTLGASPRAGLHLLAASRALALLRGRDYVSADDLIALAAPVLQHRLKTAAGNKAKPGDIIKGIAIEICGQIPEE
jgi:MoxR-like ATPase